MNGKDAMRAPITHVLGARPNFMKAAPVIRALAALGHDQRVVHTGQHYDERMSEVFFVQLGLPRPDVNLEVGSGSHARQTAEVLTGMDRFEVAAARTGLGLPDRYVVATLHRPSNVDDPAAAAALVLALHEVADELDVVIPVHPRGRAALEAAGLGAHPRLHIAPPLGHLEFVALVRGARAG